MSKATKQAELGAGTFTWGDLGDEPCRGKKKRYTQEQRMIVKCQKRDLGKMLEIGGLRQSADI